MSSHNRNKIPIPLKALVILTVFACGFTVCANLVHLVHVNPNYEASWFKVIACLSIATFIGVCLCNEK